VLFPASIEISGRAGVELAGTDAEDVEVGGHMCLSQRMPEGPAAGAGLGCGERVERISVAAGLEQVKGAPGIGCR
jgi:hypothetical protein